MITDDIRAELKRNADGPYRQFQARLLPTVDPSRIIGVRTPVLKSMAKEYFRREDAGEFLDTLPHVYFDEDQLHAFMISLIKDFDECLCRVEAFLAFIDNWATCDQLSPKVFSRHRRELVPRIMEWIASDDTYTVRFGIGMLMSHFLDEDFDAAYPRTVAGIESGEYYVNMMRAWYFATALAKRWDDTVFYLKEEKLDVWTHNMTIRKAAESRRVSAEHKAYLRSLKR